MQATTDKATDRPVTGNAAASHALTPARRAALEALERELGELLKMTRAA